MRCEVDLLGEKMLADDCYYGIHTARARENFQISTQRTEPILLKALALVKKSCAEANGELGLLDANKAKAIAQAAQEILEGSWLEQFPLDSLQGGAGTSTNMNMNEVLANRALEILGFAKGDYQEIHPINHVNLHQSTNDVYPTALKIAVIWLIKDLSEACAELQAFLQEKENGFAQRHPP